jgi:ABC-type sugar transport system permease subunit
LILFQGAFKRVPQEVVEAAKIDGANAFRELTQIMIPMMWSTLSTLLILKLTNIFGVSGPIILFTQGAYGSTTLSYWIYEQVKEFGQYNLPAAMGLMFTAVNLPFVIIIRWLFNLKEDVEY